MEVLEILEIFAMSFGKCGLLAFCNSQDPLPEDIVSLESNSQTSVFQKSDRRELWFSSF